MKKSAFVTAAIGCLMYFQPASAQNTMMPEIINPNPGTETIVMRISDNGLWGISETAGGKEGSIAPGGILVNILNPQANVEIKHSSGLAGVSDVTDDGEIVVGECVSKPAFWRASTKEWTQLPLPAGYSMGRLTAVTPDGKIAVGQMSRDSEWTFTPVAYDLTTLQRIELPNMPHIDMANNNTGQTSLSDISADGRYIVGRVSQSYIGDNCCFLYDRQTSTYKFMGFNTPAGYDPETPMAKPAKWTPLVDNLLFCEEPQLSPNGKWVAGFAYMAVPIPGSEFFNEYNVAFLYNVETGDFQVYNGPYDADTASFAVTNDGMVLGATPVSNPYSNFMVRHDGYYYSFDEICRQVYGFDFSERSGYPVSGKPASVSADGLTLSMIPSTSTSYILRLKEPLADLCERVDLLGDYTATPAAGSVFSKISTVQLTFTRDIALAGLTKAKLLGPDGKTVRESLKIAVEGRTATISFRSTDLEPGKTYTVNVAAGTFSMAGDSKRTTKEINVSYVGREAGNVKATTIYPANGANISRLDAAANPVILTFNSNVTVAEGAERPMLYRDQEEEPMCALDIAVRGNQVYVAPLSGQYLYKGTSYRVEIPAGMVTDLSGAGPNDAITLTYTGTYTREVNPDDQVLFNQDGTITTLWMFYDGDQNQPVNAIAAWGFTKEYPWFSVRSSNSSSDWALASHSMYTPAGKSDDWASTVQLYLPDDRCVLTFDSQSYLKSKKDVLKVYLLATDDIINYLTADVVKRFRSEGTVIYDEVQSPGESEEGLEGDWRHNSISLAKYAGKSVYIAFVNENEDQSAIFLDNIKVEREIKYMVDFTNPTAVVDQQTLPISGNITIATDLKRYSTLSVELRDAEDKVVDTYTASGLSLGKGDSHKFSFSKPLPLVTGEVNNFTLGIKLDDESSVYAGSVKDLAFEPVQRVVLEEYTGSACGNCPMGILAIENLERIYGDRFIPITLRCYSGDPLGNGVTNLASFLGLQAAPTGLINRGVVSSPMIENGRDSNDFRFSAVGTEQEPTWLDLVQKEFENNAVAQVDVIPTYDDATGQVSATCSVRSALNLSAQSFSLLGIITENGLTTYQENYRYQSTNPIFGEWGAGGQYGSKLVYPYVTNDVARGCFGNTFNGTGGLIPSDIKAGETYTASLGGALPGNVADANNCYFNVLLIDTNTNRVVNAARAKLTSSQSVDSVGGDTLSVKVAGSTVVVAGSGIVSANIYNMQGMLLDSASAEGEVTITAAAKGFVILEAADARGRIVRKLVIR